MFNGDPSETDAKKLVAEIMSKVIVKSVPRGVETGLYWKEPEQSGAMVEGSQRRVCASLQSGENGTLLAISDDAFDLPEELLRDLLAAFYQMRPISMHLKLRAEMPLTDLLRLALGPGPQGIPEVLRRFAIDSEVREAIVLHIGDTFPEESLTSVQYSMSVTFEAQGGFLARAFSTCRQLPVHPEHKIKAIQNAFTQNLILESEQCFVTVSYCLSLTLAVSYCLRCLLLPLLHSLKVGEYVAVKSVKVNDGQFVLGRVAQWRQASEANLRENSIMRQYNVQLSPKGLPEILFHKDLYKISGQGNPISIDQSGSQLLTFDGVGDNSAANDSTGNTGKLKEIKAQLREMSGMDENQYKSTLRRLYLTWHPDKAGNTPFNNMILRLLVKHKQWKDEGGGDDSWLEDFEDHQADTGCNNTEAQACSAGLARSSDDIGCMMLCRCPCFSISMMCYSVEVE